MTGLPSITNSQSLPKLTSIESVISPNHLILCHPLLLQPSIFLSIRVFSNESTLQWPKSGGQSIGVSTSVLAVNTQDLSPLGCTGWIPCSPRRLFFLSSKITADGDCSCEIKRHLLLGSKVMINLDSILKIRDINLPIKVHLVKAMVFPVVIYGCESWTTKKASNY